MRLFITSLAVASLIVFAAGVWIHGYQTGIADYSQRVIAPTKIRPMPTNLAIVEATLLRPVAGK